MKDKTRKQDFYREKNYGSKMIQKWAILHHPTPNTLAM